MGRIKLIFSSQAMAPCSTSRDFLANLGGLLALEPDWCAVRKVIVSARCEGSLTR